MPADLQKARALFLHAVGKLPPEEWAGYVAEACGGDAELPRQAGRLLQVHRKADSLLDWPTAGDDRYSDQSAIEAGTALGREPHGAGQ
jgi:hypothetical protein